MSEVNFRSFHSKVRHRKSAYRKFLTRAEKRSPLKLDSLSEAVDREVWTEVNCQSCANCCKLMSPTYTQKDIRRIASHLSMTVIGFKKKWLTHDKKNGDWLNRSTPCQFLDLETNKCGIYEVRPKDCAGFPHLPKKRMADYIHVHKQNIEFCPATFKMVEKMILLLKNS